MMQETTTIGPASTSQWDLVSGQSLMTLLALVGARRMDVETLRHRTRLAPPAFEDLVNWLQGEYLVEIVSSLEGDQVKEKVALTERGEAVLVSMLESTCELPDYR